MRRAANLPRDRNPELAVSASQADLMWQRGAAQPVDSPATGRACDLGACAVVAAFLVVGAYGLGRVPLVHEDEAWIVEPGVVFWREGRLGSDLMRGFAGSEHQYYHVTPLVPLLAGLVSTLAGLGLVQARALSVALGSIAIGATYLAGRRLRSPVYGLVAATVAASWPIAVLEPFHRTGVPLLDLARIARYDIGVPAFGALALVASVRLWRADLCGAGRRHSVWRAFGVGLLCACATLNHVYGGAWMVGLAFALAIGRSPDARRSALAVAGGWALGLVPWMLWVAVGWPLAREQAGPSAYHFAFTSPADLIANVAHEWRRYTPVARAILSLSPAAWAWGLAIVAGLCRLVPAARRGDVGGIILTMLLACHVVLYAALLHEKHFRYAASLWPVLALIAAEGIGAAWTAARGRGRALVVIGAALATLSGGLAVVHLRNEVRRTTPYDQVCRALAAHMPSGARVLAMQHYWFGLAGHVADYRSMLVPVSVSDPRWNRTGTTFAAAADATRADIVIVDPVLRRFWTEAASSSHPFHSLARDMQAYLRTGWRLRAAVDDVSYGRFEIHERISFGAGPIRE